MNENTKSQAIDLGHVLDVESINRNVIGINSLNPNYRYLFGKSSPMITDYDIAEHDLFPDANFCNSLTKADQHLRSQGLIPVWNTADTIRFHRHQLLHRSWKVYTGGNR